MLPTCRSMALRQAALVSRRCAASTRCAPASARALSGASTTAVRTADIDSVDDELEASSSLSGPGPTEEMISSFDPVARSRERTEELPPSRYRYRPPRYYRGPLHPHQPPRVSDPASREFIPGPFTLPRLEQTYQSQVEADLMTMTYTHVIPGTERPPPAPRLRSWDDSSPYHKNRPLRGPRGGDSLPLLRQPITFRNVPRVTRITVQSMVKEAKDDSAHLHVAGMVLQAITGVRVTPTRSRHNVVGWGLRAGKFLSVKADLHGEDMWHFLARVVDLVMPRIKDYRGVKGSSGDSSGNISFGFTPEQMENFPEIEVNYDAYPPKMIPGCHITVHTSATTDRDARLLLSSLGVPFYGKHVN